MDLIANILLIIGSICALIGAVGLIRLPDVYNRLHASTVVVVGGVVVMILGAGLLNGPDVFLLKSIIITFIIFLTTPTGSHAIARVAYIRGVDFYKETIKSNESDEKIRNDPGTDIDPKFELEDFIEDKESLE